MLKSNLFSGFFFLLISIFVCQQSIGLGIGALSHPGSGFLPFCTGVGIGILALVLLFQSIASKRSQVEAENKIIPQRGKFLLVSFSLFGYIIAVNFFGFILSTFAFVLFLLCIFKFARIWFMVMSAALITAGNYVIFEVWLGLNLPKGTLIIW